MFGWKKVCHRIAGRLKAGLELQAGDFLCLGGKALPKIKQAVHRGTLKRCGKLGKNLCRHKSSSNIELRQNGIEGVSPASSGHRKNRCV